LCPGNITIPSQCQFQLINGFKKYFEFHLLQNADAENKGEEKFVLFKKRATDVVVQIEHEMINHILESLFQDAARITGK